MKTIPVLHVTEAELAAAFAEWEKRHAAIPTPPGAVTLQGDMSPTSKHSAAYLASILREQAA